MRKKYAGTDVLVHGLNGHVKLRVITKDVVCELALIYDRLYNCVDAVYIPTFVLFIPCRDVERISSYFP